jgi:uncharacterized lipoprotein
MKMMSKIILAAILLATLTGCVTHTYKVTDLDTGESYTLRSPIYPYASTAGLTITEAKDPGITHIMKNWKTEIIE